MGGTVSKAITPVTARGLHRIPKCRRRSCWPFAEHAERMSASWKSLEPGRSGLLVRLSATSDAALAARNRLAREPDRAGWRIEFELVTPLGR